ncbi:hypothetical protein NDU88_004842 [Pleurodeles waltl]|uniref:Uncharacterized protein n=1 Tax=Pleurodeles waltl TaxID=8319 RepID=A0AAV7NM82_PLEWA|nr:hypothetical protein NDU88_004842 [Pleurodeles waltl]
MTRNLDGCNLPLPKSLGTCKHPRTQCFAQAALTPQRDPRSGLSRSRGESKGKPATNSKSDGIPGEWRSEMVFQAASDKRRGSTGLLGDVVLSPTLAAPALAQSLTETVRRFCTHAAAGPAKQRRAQSQTSSKQQVRRYPTVSPGYGFREEGDPQESAVQSGGPGPGGNPLASVLWTLRRKISHMQLPDPETFSWACGSSGFRSGWSCSASLR